LAFFGVVTTMAASDPLPQKPAPDGAFANFTGKLLIIQNSDGTFTIRKMPTKGKSKDGKAGNGLVIPAQVVAPTFAPSERKTDAAPPGLRVRAATT
jgi:hypothetical protein